jgi:hypothetical protein
MSGSISVVRQLLAAGLLDELHLLVHPIAVRKGMRLFDEGETPIPLKLLSSQAFSTGVLHLVYGPGESPGDATYEDAKVHLSKREQLPPATRGSAGAGVAGCCCWPAGRPGRAPGSPGGCRRR